MSNLNVKAVRAKEESANAMSGPWPKDRREAESDTMAVPEPEVSAGRRTP